MRRLPTLGLSLLLAVVAISVGVAMWWDQADGSEDGRAVTESPKVPSPLKEAPSSIGVPIPIVPFRDPRAADSRTHFGWIVDQDFLPVSSATVVAMRAQGVSLVPIEGGLRATTAEDGSFELIVEPETIALSIDAGESGRGLLALHEQGESRERATLYKVWRRTLKMMVVGDVEPLPGAQCEPVLRLGKLQVYLSSLSCNAKGRLDLSYLDSVDSAPQTFLGARCSHNGHLSVEIADLTAVSVGTEGVHVVKLLRVRTLNVVVQGIEPREGSVRLAITLELQKPFHFEAEVDLATLRSYARDVPWASRASAVALDESLSVCCDDKGVPNVRIEDDTLTVLLGSKGHIEGRILDYSGARGAPHAVRLKGLKEHTIPLDDRGQFSKGGLEQGIWEIVAIGEKGVMPLDRMRMEHIDPAGPLGQLLGIKPIVSNLSLSLDGRLLVTVSQAHLATRVDLAVADPTSSPSSGHIRGVVLHHDRKPAVGITVEVYTYSPSRYFGTMPAPVGTATTNDVGAFELTVHPGTYTMRGTHPTLPAVYEAPVVLKAGEERAVELLLPKPVVCELLVVAPEGTPIPGVNVVVYGPSGPPPSGPTQDKHTDRLDAAVTDIDGVARFRRIGIGTRYLILEGGVPVDLALGRVGNAPVRQVIVDVTSKTVRETLRLQRYSFIQGSLVNEYGLPCAHAGFYICEGGEGGKKRMVRTDAAGNFLIHFNHEGPWVITQLFVNSCAQEFHDVIGSLPEVLSDPVLWAREQPYIVTYRR